MMRFRTCLCPTAALLLCALAPVFPQTTWAKNGDFITPKSLPAEFTAMLQKMGGRLTSAATATVSLAGTLTDADGTRSVQITVQAPGYLRFQDSTGSRVLTYDGSQWSNKSNKADQADAQIQESLLAQLPDSFLLQLANGGSIRRIGVRFRTDNGKTPNYTGPYWTLYAYSPASRSGLNEGQALQQNYFVAVDEKTWFIAEIRLVAKLSANTQRVTQTKFNNWFQQSGQWYPGEILRLENGQQVLKLTVQQASTSGQLAVAAFHP